MGSLSSEVIYVQQPSGLNITEETSSDTMSRRRSRTNVEDKNEDENEKLRKDAVFMASAMAGADNDNRTISPSHNAQESIGGNDYDKQGLTGLQSTSGSVQSEPHNSTILLNSPMVTPPARIYTTTATSKTHKSQQRPRYAGVPHVYHDYSQVPDQPDYNRKKTGGVSQPFPEKLHQMLKEVEGTPDEEVVSWLGHGRAFIVKIPKQFTDRIMPLHFKQTKLTSFQRQLNLYGFRRLTQGPDAGAYYHEKFLRARPALCQQMVRQKVKGTGHKQPADAKTEPNFYLMPPVGELISSASGNESNLEPQVLYTSPPVDTMASDEQTEDFASQPSSTYVSMSNRNMYSRLPQIMLDSMSPASPGMRGAAHLLQGIAAGHAGTLSMPMDSSPPDQPGTDGDEADAPSTSFLQPRISSSSNFLPSYDQAKDDETAE